jgi:hypothetical protein
MTQARFKVGLIALRYVRLLTALLGALCIILGLFLHQYDSALIGLVVIVGAVCGGYKYESWF